MFFLDISISDSTSQFIISILVTIIIGYIGIHITLRQQTRKRLTRQIVSSRPIKEHNAIDPDLKLRLNNQTITNGHHFTLKIWNSGNTAIAKKDFEKKPYVISFGSKATVVKAEIKDSSFLHTLTADEFFSRENSISIGPLTLNAGDYILFTVILNNYSLKTKLQDRVHITNGRIIKIDDTGKGTFTSRMNFYRSTAMFFCLLVCLGVITALQFYRNMSSIFIFLLIIILTTITVVFLAAVFTSLLSIFYS